MVEEALTDHAVRHGLFKHGSHKHPEYRCWLNARDRCRNPNTPYFYDYGGRPFDIRLQIGNAGNDKHADVEAIGRMASVALRAGVHVGVLVDHLEGIGGQSVFGFGDKRVRSVGDGLGKLLRSLYLVRTADPAPLGGDSALDPAERSTAPQERNLFGVCPKCKNATLVMESGCQHCEIRLGGCGEYSACG